MKNTVVRKPSPSWTAFRLIAVIIPFIRLPHLQLGAENVVVLLLLCHGGELGIPAADTHLQILMVFRMDLGVFQLLFIDHVELYVRWA